MKFWVKILLALCAIGAIVGVYYWDEKTTKSEADLKTSSSKVFAFEPQQVRKVSLTSDGTAYNFERENGTAEWKMLAPKTVRPDQDSLNNLVSALQSLRLERELEGTEKTATGTAPESAQFGIDKPRFLVKLELEGNKTEELAVGGDVNIGNTSGGNFVPVSVYARTPAHKNLILVDSSVVSTLKKNFSDFRTKLAGDFKPADVKSFTLSKVGAESISLAREDKDWKVTQPRPLPGDTNNTALYLDKLARLQVNKVMEANEVTPEKRASMGFDSPSATVELKGEGDKVLQTLQFGLTKEAIYVTMADGAYGVLDVANWSEYAPELKYFRDRRVLKGFNLADVERIKTENGRVFQKEGANWYLIEKDAAVAASPTPGANAGAPEKASSKAASDFFSDWEFLTADDIIEGPLAENLGNFGLDKPITRFTFEPKVAEQKPEEILVGNRVPKNEKSVYVKRAGHPEIYIVETTWLDKLTEMAGTGPQAKK